MKNFLTTFLAVIVAQVVLVGVFLFALIAFGTLMMGRAGVEGDVPREAYLVQSIPASLLEHEASPRLPLPRKVTTQTEILENLEKARVDPRVRAVVLKLDPFAPGWGKGQEIRARIRQLRESGTPVYAYLPVMTNPGFYVASACDSIFVPPQGLVWLSGMMAERFFVKGLFEKLGIETQVSQIDDYKAAAEMVMRKEMSGPARENAEWVLNDLYDELRATVATDREVTPERVADWFEQAQFSPEEALATGLIDGIAGWETIEARLHDRWPFAEELCCERYEEVPRASLGLRGPRIAVVHGEGTIIAGKSGWGPPFGVSMGDETMIAALEQAADDDQILGILLRLDTPGGLGLASNRIGEAVARAAVRKPVVVSSVDLNASGGYMVSYRCSTIVALPNAIVGSIGSFAMRPSFAELLEKLGVSTDRVTVGPHATAFSSVLPMTREEFERFDATHRAGYRSWIAGVAEYRGMSIEEVEAMAGGRVFTGRQALQRGLVDVLGGFDEALALLKIQAGLDPDAPVTLLHYPERRSLIEELRSGDWTAALDQGLVTLGLRSRAQAEALEMLTFWQTVLAGEEPLMLCPWRVK